MGQTPKCFDDVEVFFFFFPAKSGLLSIVCVQLGL